MESNKNKTNTITEYSQRVRSNSEVTPEGYEWFPPIPTTIPFRRKCERRNHIPHPTPLRPNYAKWRNTYYEQLIDIHAIVSEIISDKYPRIKNIHKETLFKLLFNSSSKYITPWIEKSPGYDNWVTGNYNRITVIDQ